MPPTAKSEQTRTPAERTQPVYRYSGEGDAEDRFFRPSPYVTDDGVRLHFYSSDAPGSAPAGHNTGGVWHVYTDDVFEA